MYTYYYQLRFEYLTETFFREMLNRNLEDMQNETITIKKLRGEPGYQYYFLKTDTEQYITGFCGKQVIWIGYTGNKDLESFSSDVVDILQ